MKEIILAKYGEIILKGGNRPKFENILMNNIRNSLKNVAEVKARLAQATIYVEVFDEDKMDIVVERLSKIFGIVSITRAVVCEKDIEDIKNPAALAPTNLQLYRKFMEKYLRQRPEVNTDLTLMVRHMEATQCGLPIEFYCFIKDRVWVNYEDILADIMEHAYALANEFGLKIYEQYPEQ